MSQILFPVKAMSQNETMLKNIDDTTYGPKPKEGITPYPLFFSVVPSKSRHEHLGQYIVAPSMFQTPDTLWKILGLTQLTEQLLAKARYNPDAEEWIRSVLIPHVTKNRDQYFSRIAFVKEVQVGPQRHLPLDSPRSSNGRYYENLFFLHYWEYRSSLPRHALKIGELLPVPLGQTKVNIEDLTPQLVALRELVIDEETLRDFAQHIHVKQHNTFSHLPGIDLYVIDESKTVLMDLVDWLASPVARIPRVKTKLGVEQALKEAEKWHTALHSEKLEDRKKVLAAMPKGGREMIGTLSCDDTVFQVVHLKDEPALKYEGKLMMHCVGTYAHQLRPSTDHYLMRVDNIFLHLVNPAKENERYTVHAKSRHGQVTIDQIRGAQNASCPYTKMPMQVIEFIMNHFQEKNVEQDQHSHST